ncbi:MAG: hypothetical protein Q7K45_02445 [Nanoarchaeota archaeon]|nr:hypothetical protein [Nanoarchaeota archaeon]
MFNNKKGAEWVITVIVIFMVVMIAGYFVINYFRAGSEKGFGVVSTQLGALEDYDDDKTANFFDGCPCTSVGTIEDPKLNGCPRGTTAQQSQENKKLFKDGKCAEIAPMAGESETITSLELSDGKIKITAESLYKTTQDSLQYKGTCEIANACTLKIIYPNTLDETIGLEATGEIKLETTGRYTIFLMQEPNKQKIRYLIEKQE